MKGNSNNNWTLALMLFVTGLSFAIIVNLPNWITNYVPSESFLILWLIMFSVVIWKLTD